MVAGRLRTGVLGAFAEEAFGKKERDLPKPLRRPLPGTAVTPEEKKEIDAKLAGLDRQQMRNAEIRRDGGRRANAR